jgi:beta-1,4-N-acetylglucosaminyltransferase
MNRKDVLFISSTGGHLHELTQLSSLFEKYNYHIITEKDNTTIKLKKKYNKKIDYLVYGTRNYFISYIFKFSFNILKSIYLFAKYRPKVIVTTGTHTAVPMCYIGKVFGSKIIFIETFANSKTKTLSGRLVYPIADKFIVQWEEMKLLYPKSEFWGWVY